MHPTLSAKLDAYITGSGYRRTTEELTCCNGHVWEAAGYTEYGLWSPHEDSGRFCPECGEEGDL